MKRLKRPMNPYTHRIVSLLQVNEDMARKIEDIMRDMFGTLDDLTKEQLKEAAQMGLKVIKGEVMRP
jgi:hypothetical protein